MSLNKNTKELHLENSKRLADGTLLYKVDKIGFDGKRESGFYMNGERKADLIGRFNLKTEESGWLSFKSISSRVT